MHYENQQRSCNGSTRYPLKSQPQDPKLALELSGLLHSLASVNVHKESQRFASLMRRAAAVQVQGRVYCGGCVAASCLLGLVLGEPLTGLSNGSD